MKLFDKTSCQTLCSTVAGRAAGRAVNFAAGYLRGLRLQCILRWRDGADLVQRE